MAAARRRSEIKNFLSYRNLQAGIAFNPHATRVGSIKCHDEMFFNFGSYQSERWFKRPPDKG